MVNYNKNDLIKFIIEDNKTYEEIGRLYKVSGNAIKKAAKRFGIDLPQRRKINPNETFNKIDIINRKKCPVCGKPIDNLHNTFCSNTCFVQNEYNEYIKRWKNGEENGLKGEYGISNYIRKYFFEKYNCKCQLCGWGKKNEYTNKTPLELHHVDGDYTNNVESNLQLLCPNCHSLTETFKSHNKNGRKDRKKYT